MFCLSTRGESQEESYNGEYKRSPQVDHLLYIRLKYISFCYSNNPLHYLQGKLLRVELWDCQFDVSTLRRYDMLDNFQWFCDRLTVYYLICVLLSQEQLCTYHRLCQPLIPARASPAYPSVIEAQAELTLWHLSNHLSVFAMSVPPRIFFLLQLRSILTHKRRDFTASSGNQ